MFSMDPHKTLKITANTLKKDSLITRFINNETGKLEGLAFGKMTTPQIVFETEEIKNPLLQSLYENPDIFANEEHFFHKVEHHFDLKANDPMFYISCIASHPSRRGFSSFYKLMHNFVRSLSSEERQLFMFFEITDGKEGDILVATTQREIFGLLVNGHRVSASKMEYYTNLFLQPKKELFKHLKKFLLEKKRGYKSHLKNNPKVDVQECSLWKRSLCQTEHTGRRSDCGL